MIEAAAIFMFSCAGLAALALGYRFIKQAWAEEATVRLRAIAIDAENNRLNAEVNAKLRALAALTGQRTSTPTPPPTPPKGTKKAPPLFKLVKKDGDSKDN